MGQLGRHAGMVLLGGNDLERPWELAAIRCVLDARIASRVVRHAGGKAPCSSLGREARGQFPPEPNFDAAWHLDSWAPPRVYRFYPAELPL